MELTDEIVTRTLAEVMGEASPNLDKWIGTECFYATNMTPLKISPFLTSYDAIAEVYRKFIDKHGTNHDLPVGDWWEHRPRDHAYALAEAILSHKETPDG